MPPGNPLIKPVAAIPKPKLANPFNGLGVEGSGLAGQPMPYSQAMPPAPAAPAPAPQPAFDFSTLVGTDPQYIREQALNKNQNDLAMGNPQTGDLGTLLRAFRGQAQGYQDNANAHGALFSGAAVHANNYAAQQYADQTNQQSQNYNTAQSNSLASAWQRILQQYAGGA